MSAGKDAMQIAALEALNEGLEDENERLRVEVETLKDKLAQKQEQELDPSKRDYLIYPKEEVHKEEMYRQRKMYEEVYKVFGDEYQQEYISKQMKKQLRLRQMEMPIKQSVVVEHNGNITLSMWYDGTPPEKVQSFRMTKGSRSQDLLREATAMLMSTLTGVVQDDIVVALSISFLKLLVKEGVHL